MQSRISHKCLALLCNFCTETRESCACTHCHKGPCKKCGADNLKKTYDGLCANCERDRAHSTPFAGTPCVDCGQLGAFRMPADRTSPFRCTTCWREAGSLSEDGQSSPIMALDCYAEDIASPLHTWRFIRGNQFGCRCGIKKYDAKAKRNMQGLGDAIMREKVKD